MKFHRNSTAEFFVKWVGSTIYDRLFPILGISESHREDIVTHSVVDSVIYHGSESSLALSRPLNDSYPEPFANAPPEVSFPQPFIAEFRNAMLLGEDAVGITANREIITETTYRASNITDARLDRAKLAYDIGIDGRFGLGPSTVIKGACIPLIDQWSSGYFHWIADQITKLTSFRPYQEATGIRPTLLIEANPPSWKTESLQLLGFESEDWIEWDGHVAHCDRLLVPSQRRVEHYVLPSSIQWIHERVRSNLEPPTDGARKIYVSREDASRRRVLNASEIRDTLSTFGFEIFRLSELSFREQAELFGQADVVVGPHGAGFTNTIFSDDITLIEFFGSAQQSRSLCYYGIANAMGFDYYALQADAIGNDIHIDPDQLTGFLP